MRAVMTASILALAVAAVDGRVLYETKCAQCHGKDGVVRPPGAGSRNFNDPAFQSAMGDDAIAKITAEGKGKMPPYRSKLSPEQIRAVAAHVKTLGASK
jgi:mono/diheme cytochrome c family protein